MTISTSVSSGTSLHINKMGMISTTHVSTIETLQQLEKAGYKIIAMYFRARAFTQKLKPTKIDIFI